MRGLVRLSGPRAHEIGESAVSIAGSAGAAPPNVANWRDGFLNIGAIRGRLPAALLTWHAPRSYTGQAMAEVHTIGNPAILQALLGHALERGARLANPGEFTLRAFLAGKLDLTRAEAVLGVIDAESPAQLEAALQQLAGGVARPILALRDRLLDQLALLEANLDFVDEPDVELWQAAEMAACLERSASDVRGLIASIRDRDVRDHRPRVVLAGPPNAGKSRLFNALIGLDRAIVSPLAGTTRDYLSSPIDCLGIPIELIDTAGLASPSGAIDEAAQSHRGDQVDRADLILSCRSGDAGEIALDSRAPRIEVWTKADRFPGVPRAFLRTSAETGEGMDDLRRAIAEALGAGRAEGSMLASTALRCRESLRKAAESLESARVSLSAGLGGEILALDIRRAVEDLGEVVGEVVTDDILDRIFGRFCIGK